MLCNILQLKKGKEIAANINKSWIQEGMGRGKFGPSKLWLVSFGIIMPFKVAPYSQSMSSDLDCRAPRVRACANLVPIPRAPKNYM